jgi:hypothetical protein
MTWRFLTCGGCRRMQAARGKRSSLAADAVGGRFCGRVVLGFACAALAAGRGARGLRTGRRVLTTNYSSRIAGVRAQASMMISTGEAMANPRHQGQRRPEHTRTLRISRYNWHDRMCPRGDAPTPTTTPTPTGGLAASRSYKPALFGSSRRSLSPPSPRTGLRSASAPGEASLCADSEKSGLPEALASAGRCGAGRGSASSAWTAAAAAPRCRAAALTGADLNRLMAVG